MDYPLEAGVFLHGIFMLVSKCHKCDLEIEQDFYRCGLCGKPCDTLFISNMDDDYDPSGYDGKVEALFDQA